MVAVGTETSKFYREPVGRTDHLGTPVWTNSGTDPTLNNRPIIKTQSCLQLPPVKHSLTLIPLVTKQLIFGQSIKQPIFKFKLSVQISYFQFSFNLFNNLRLSVLGLGL